MALSLHLWKRYRTNRNGNSLRGGYSKGCGCILKEAMIEVRKRLNPNPHSQLNEYKLYQAAKTRAKRDGLPFDITYQDVIIPAHCPVLGNRT